MTFLLTLLGILAVIALMVVIAVNPQGRINKRMSNHVCASRQTLTGDLDALLAKAARSKRRRARAARMHEYPGAGACCRHSTPGQLTPHARKPANAHRNRGQSISFV